jgi:hypothetical protein
MHSPYRLPDVSPPAKASRQARTQIVGRRCDRCREKIIKTPDGVACIECERAYHHDCLADPDRCAKCGQSMSLLERAAREAEASVTRQTARQGRVLAWAAVLPFAFLEVTLLGFALSTGAMAPIVAVVVRVALEVLLVWTTFNGSLRARRLLAFFSGAGVVYSVVRLIDAKPPASLVAGGFIIECGFAFWVFAYATAARVYLDSNAPAVRPSSR